LKHAVKILSIVIVLLLSAIPVPGRGEVFITETVTLSQRKMVMIYKPQDRIICEKLLKLGLEQNWASRPMNELVLLVGKYFLGTRYMYKTLETKGPEDLVINLRRMDCFTFLENAVVLAKTIKNRKTSFEDFASALQETRYRSGEISGYASRLHYFCDWLHNSEQKGFVKDITKDLGGEPFAKVVNFMTKNRRKYPALRRDDSSYVRMQDVESRISDQCRDYIPKHTLRDYEQRIHNGDLIAITTTIDGLDVVHVGLAVFVGKRLHLLHASATERKVVITPRTLYGYLAGRKVRSGVVVARVI
jgi:hypothetical protein